MISTVSYWDAQPTDKPYLLNGFNGTWALSEHSMISGELMNYLHEVFHKEERLKRVPIEQINKCLNDVWEGPGSMSKIARLTVEMRNARLSKKITDDKAEPVKTIDDYSDEEKTSSVSDSFGE